MKTIHLVTLLRLAQVEKATGLKKSAIYEKMKKREFPASVSLGGRAVAWRSDEIQKWIEERPRTESEEVK